MSDASDLSTYMQAGSRNTSRLVALTNYGSTTGATTVNSTVLEACCAEGLADFALRFGSYDGTKALHKRAAAVLTELVLYERSDDEDRAAALERRASALFARLAAARTFEPVTDAFRIRTEPTGTEYLPFDDTHFDGWKINDGTVGSSEVDG